MKSRRRLPKSSSPGGRARRRFRSAVSSRTFPTARSPRSARRMWLSCRMGRSIPRVRPSLSISRVQLRGRLEGRSERGPSRCSRWRVSSKCLLLRRRRSAQLSSTLTAAKTPSLSPRTTSSLVPSRSTLAKWTSTGISPNYLRRPGSTATATCETARRRSASTPPS